MATLIPSWTLALEQANLSPGTIRSYCDTVRAAAEWLAKNDMPDDVEQVTSEHVRAFLLDVMGRTSPGNAHKHMRNLKVYFNWCIKEKERTLASPMIGISNIKVPPKASEVFADSDLRALVRACTAEDDFEHRRDHAIIRILMDNGVRVSGLAGLRYTPDDEKTNDVFLQRHELRIRLKGGREFWAPIGKKAAAALDRYIRARARHPHADSEWLWLPTRSRPTRLGDYRLTADGIGRMIERRSCEAGLGKSRPHKFRRTMATNWEGSDIDLMHIGGWETLQMVELYTRARREGKSREAFRRKSPGDRI
jgi:site-specific recombinase XerD